MLLRELGIKDQINIPKLFLSKDGVKIKIDYGVKGRDGKRVQDDYGNFEQEFDN